jgi:putative membrane-bound dehydrogenase-like protein
MNRAAVLLLLLLCAAGLAPAEKIPQATDAPRPLSPEESRKRFRLPEGLRIELVAAEPQVAEPTGLCFDGRGRLFVCELHGYNLDGYYDIVELNKTGVLDTAVRRIPASKEAEQRAAQETYGTVRLLQTDDRGRVIRSTVFADRLPPCYGIVPARDGIIVLCAPDIVFLADRDGDGKAEVRETLFTGFGVGEIWSRISNPRWGADNWIYAASGQASGGTIRGPHLRREVKLGSTCFRFKPDGSRIEPVSGGTSGFGLALDDWGDRFLCTNQQHALYVAPLPYHALARNLYSPATDAVVNVCSYGHPARVFPTSPPDPWRRKRGQQAEWVKFYGAAETDAGLFTSACAPTLYLADLLPETYRGNHFSCEPAQNLIHRCLLEPRGAGFGARRAEADQEFLTSTDSWFRPVNLAVGPEGALYVVDMYREIIEDYSAIPRYLQQQYMESLRNGHDRGRIWRIVADGPTRATNANLDHAPTDRLLGELASPNAWRRLTAQRLLVERHDRTTVPALQELCRAGRTPQARLHALYTLQALEALTPAQVREPLADRHPGVRVNALQLAERWLDRDAGLLSKVLTKVDDPAAKVRLQLAFTLGESHSPDVLPALARLVEAEGQDRWMQAAVLSAVPDRSARLVRVLVEAGGERGHNFLVPLAAVTGARADADEVAGLLEWLADLKGQRTMAIREKVLTGLAEGLARGAARQSLGAAGRKALECLLAESSGDARTRAIQVAGLLHLDASPALTAMRKAAALAALDQKRPMAERLESLSALAGAPPAELAPLRELLHPRHALDLQLAAAQLLAATDSPEAVAALLKDWSSYSPRVQTAILDGVCARKTSLPLVLDAIEKKVIDPSSLPPVRQTQLLESPDRAIRQRAKALLAGRASSAERKAVLERYQRSLSLPRDSRKGQEVFDKQCLKCHQLNGRGFAVGPDLAAIQNRPDESILVDILDPSSTIVAGYRTYTVTTRGGRIFTGVLSGETATSVTLRREQGAEDTLLRKDIDEMHASATSLMPEAVEKEVSEQDLANLLGYLREALRPASGGRVLFDGDAAFVQALHEGDGKAVLASDEPFVGKPSLRISPPQRFAPRIAGWEFPIAQKPGPGEYRYLRFAWKSPAGSGVMLELADNGAWPPAGEARGRFYSGTNTTGWKAVRVAEQVPRDWVVVTVDLWKECGTRRLTGLAPTAMGGDAFFGRIELLPALHPQKPQADGKK